MTEEHSSKDLVSKDKIIVKRANVITELVIDGELLIYKGPCKFVPSPHRFRRVDDNKRQYDDTDLFYIFEVIHTGTYPKKNHGYDAYETIPEPRMGNFLRLSSIGGFYYTDYSK